MNADTSQTAQFVNEKTQRPTNGFQMSQLILRADTPQLSPIEKLVLLCLADRAALDNDGNLACFPSIALIQQQTGAGRRTIQNALATLEQMEFITRTPRRDTTTVYAINPDVFMGRIICTGGRRICTPGGAESAPKKNRRKEQVKEQKTPQTPLAGGVRRRVSMDALEQAVYDVCPHDRQMSVKRAKRVAVYLREIGATPDIVHGLPDYIRSNWPTYEGPVTWHHIMNYAGDHV